MFRYSLAALLGLISVVALGCAALVQATHVWRQAAITLTVAALLFAPLAALFIRGRLRAFAAGFAVIGWLYFLLMFVPALGLREKLLTHTAVEGLWTVFHEDQDDVQAVAFSPDGKLFVRESLGRVNSFDVRAWDSTTGTVFVSGQSSGIAAFTDIGHALWTLLLACIGGMAARYMAGNAEKPTAQ
jgi:hypothetical protein